jgi:hypothetical protein
MCLSNVELQDTNKMNKSGLAQSAASDNDIVFLMQKLPCLKD